MRMYPLNHNSTQTMPNKEETTVGCSSNCKSRRTKFDFDRLAFWVRHRYLTNPRSVVSSQWVDAEQKIDWIAALCRSWARLCFIFVQSAPRSQEVYQYETDYIINIAGSKSLRKTTLNPSRLSIKQTPTVMRAFLTHCNQNPLQLRPRGGFVSIRIIVCIVREF